MVSLQGYLRLLHPSFDDCPRPCSLTAEDPRPRDLPDYCAECEVRAQLKFFEEATRRDLGRRFEPGECPASFEELEADVYEVMSLAARFERYPPNASALVARAIDVVRREQDRPERISNWELSQRK